MGLLNPCMASINRHECVHKTMGANYPSNKTWHLSTMDAILVLSIFVYFLLFEVIYFIYGEFFSLGFFVTIYKIAFPVILFIYTYSKYGIGISSNRLLKNYIFFFTMFLVVGFVSSALSSSDSVIIWLKYLPRYIFFISVGILFMRRHVIMNLVLGCIVVWAIASTFQYAIMEIFKIYQTHFPYPMGNGVGAGLYGLFGNITASHSFDSYPIALYRLTGFWQEPSNASAVLFASFFLSRYIGIFNNKKFWNRASYVCLIGGIMTFSNAGYLALGAAIAFGALTSLGRAGNLTKKLFIIGVAFCLIFFALFGRTYIARYVSNGDILRILGVPSDKTRATIDLNYTYGDRIAITQNAIATVSENPIGIGFKHHSSAEILGALSASSLVRWFVYTGVPGVIMLLLRDLWLWIKMVRVSLSKRTLLLGQAYIVIAVQQLSYGEWMNPLYLILAATILAVPVYLTSNSPTSRDRLTD
jgi:hypothetical protein